MGEPLARMDTGDEGVLADAARRLERALQVLEKVVDRPPASMAAHPVQLVELEIVRQRSRELESVAVEASQALGRAVAEVQRALLEDEVGTPDPQTSLFDAGLLDSPLESEPVLPDEGEAAPVAGEKEPTA